MIVLFMANRIIDGYTTFQELPDLLKKDVKKELIKQGYEHLVGGA